MRSGSDTFSESAAAKGGAHIDTNLDAVALEAEAVLRNRPVDLARGRTLVEQYQRGVTSG